MYKAKVQALKSFLDEKISMRKKGSVWKINDREKVIRFESLGLIKVLEDYTGKAVKMEKGYETKMIKDFKNKAVIPQAEEISEPEIQEVTQGEGVRLEPEAEIKHIGGGYYELPDGSRIRGKDNALKELRG
jgi:hypothetical protein